jgi:hypothetical protein
MWTPLYSGLWTLFSVPFAVTNLLKVDSHDQKRKKKKTKSYFTTSNNKQNIDKLCLFLSMKRHTSLTTLINNLLKYSSYITDSSSSRDSEMVASYLQNVIMKLYIPVFFLNIYMILQLWFKILQKKRAKI